MKSKLGAFLLVAAGVLIFAVAGEQTLVNNALAAVATLGLAAGALLLGTAGEEGRPV
ncbi:hypothetical protein [Halorussus amylolyticus]|uniref:hypothetical protein n=1 Tax=Halorussus amylolyticus TaxID=1126242 RepID=UPI00138ECBE6|nr:hypothetical protein [Halorussus amylolyticus]